MATTKATFSFTRCGTAALIAAISCCVWTDPASGELIGHWAFDDGLADAGSLIAADSSGKGHDAELVNSDFSPWIGESQAVYGGAIDLEGQFAAFVADLGFDLPIENDARTIMGWANVPLAHQGFVFSYGGDGNGAQFNISIEEHDGTPHVWLRHNGGNLRYPGAEVDEWVHVAAVVPEGAEFTSDVQIYINGEESEGVRGSGEDRDLFTVDSSFVIGGKWDLADNRSFEGRIDDVWFFNEPLDPSAIQAIMAGGGPGTKALQAGDANMDLKFDQVDLVQVQIAAKYLTGQPATWGEGDWDAAPGGEPGSPPTGNGFFDQLDVVAALGAGKYLTGPYAAINKGGQPNDGQTSIVYNPVTGELAVDAPAGTELTSVNIDSAASIFTGESAQNLGGSFDNDADSNIFKATFGSSFGSLTFGSVAQTGLTEDFVANDLTVIGSLNGGGDLGAVDLIFVPEPSAAVLLVLASVAAVGFRGNLLRRPTD